MNRVEKHIIKPNNKYYSLLDEFCYKSKNLYNYANYIIRQEFINNGKWIRSDDLDKMLKKGGYKMNKFCIIVGICDILVGIIDLMNGEIIMGIAILLTGYYLLFVEWE